MAFRRENSPFDSLRVKLGGLIPTKTYTAKNLDTKDETTVTDTLEITLQQKRSSVIFEYKAN